MKRDDNSKPALVLFPDGLLFPANTESLFSVANGLTFVSLQTCLVGTYVLSSEYKMMRITEVRRLQEDLNLSNLLKKTISRRIGFTVDLVDVTEKHLGVVELFKNAVVKTVNAENNVLRISPSELSEIESFKDLYHSFEYPELTDCLDCL